MASGQREGADFKSDVCQLLLSIFLERHIFKMTVVVHLLDVVLTRDELPMLSVDVSLLGGLSVHSKILCTFYLWT